MTDNKPLVSILVPIYGVEKYIVRCSRSLFEQTYDNIEYVFVNDRTPDHSIDNLKKIIKMYPQRQHCIKIVNHEVNSGLAAARITGIANSTGEYIMFVDSDDTIDKDTVSKCVEMLAHNEYDIISFGFKHVYKDKKIKEVIQLIDTETYKILSLERKIPVNLCSNLFKRDLFLHNDAQIIKGIDMGEDYATLTRILYYAKTIKVLSLPLYNYYHYNEDSYTLRFTHKNFISLVNAAKVVNDFYKRKDDEHYKQAIAVGNLRLKAQMIILLLNQKSYDLSDYRQLKCMFLSEQSQKKYLSSLNRQDRITLLLFHNVTRKLSEFYVKIGFYLKHISKR